MAEVTRRTALITGGSRGIGFGIAKELAVAGFDLGINGVRPESDVADALDELKALGAKVVYCQGNVATVDGRKSIIDSFHSVFPALNVLVNNAGVGPKVRLDLLETTEESFEHVLKTNLQGPFFLTQEFAREMAASKEGDPSFFGAIVNIGSISATIVSTNRGEYCVAKAGTAMMSQLFAARMGEYDIPVYEVRPGVIKTDMTAGATAKYDKLIAEGLCPQKRWGQPSDIGKVVAALAGGNFPYSTGSVIMVDGGLTIGRL